jgi:hypothetical protein
MTAGAPTDTVVVVAPDDGAGHAHDGSAPTVSRARWFLTLSIRPVLLYLASRAGMFLVAEATSSTAHQTLPTSLTVWDSSWYLSIAQSGYVRHIPPGVGNPAQSNLGFFPLVPLLTRASSPPSSWGWPRRSRCGGCCGTSSARKVPTVARPLSSSHPVRWC